MCDKKWAIELNAEKGSDTCGDSPEQELHMFHEDGKQKNKVKFGRVKKLMSSWSTNYQTHLLVKYLMVEKGSVTIKEQLILGRGQSWSKIDGYER